MMPGVVLRLAEWLGREPDCEPADVGARTALVRTLEAGGGR
jgi:hypothetical protein